MINPLAYFAIFLSASLFSSGGVSNLPALQAGLVPPGYAVPGDFGQAMAVGQVTPGPTGLWAVSLGYLTYGWRGAVLALVAVSIPPLLVVQVAAVYRRLERQRWVPRALAGVSVAVVGLVLAVAWSLAPRPLGDVRGWLIGAAVLGGVATRRVNPALLVVLAGGLGILLYR